MRDYRDFWREHALENIKPNRGGEFPEGWDVRPLLKRLVGATSVVEIGCGYGRLCEAFDARRYYGVDVSWSAIDLARELHPQYKFWHVDLEMPFTSYALFYNVLLHVPDEDLKAMLASVIADRVLVVEILGHKWRRDGDPPVYNREHEEYAIAFAASGYAPAMRLDVPCLCYKDTMLTFMEFARA